MLSASNIKQAAQAEGFSACGIARAQSVSAARATERIKWLAQGEQGDMDYLTRNVDKRLDPRLLVEGAKTIVSVAVNYNPGICDNSDDEKDAICDETAYFCRCNALHLSRYAYGTDYHEVVKQMLRGMMQRLGLVDLVDGRCFVDTAPIDEKYWAEQCGLGWRGRNSQLIIPGMGSYYFLGELVLIDEADAYDEKAKNRCGTCTACLSACPMGALHGDGTLDARRCLSYLTIEHRGDLPLDASKKLGNCFYGCDRCAEACPWNKRFARATTIEAFQPRASLLNMTPQQWSQLTEEEYRQLFKKSAVKRAKFEGVTRNIRCALEGVKANANKFN